MAALGVYGEGEGAMPSNPLLAVRVVVDVVDDAFPRGFERLWSVELTMSFRFASDIVSVWSAMKKKESSILRARIYLS